MSILLRMPRRRELWIDALEQRFPDQTVVVSANDIIRKNVDPADIEYVIGWSIKWDELDQYPNLKAVLLSSAGIDHLNWDLIPEDVVVTRLIDPSMSNEIAAYAVHWVVHFARHFDLYRSQQKQAVWEIAPARPNKTVGILGLGAIGTVVADRMGDFDYPVVSWSRSEKSTPYGRHYVGADELVEFFEASDYVVNLLPLSDATAHVVGAKELAALGSGVFINAGRGGTVDTEALLAALDGDLHAAVLDVFETEPLPPESPLWSHPKAVLTPHIAGETNPYTAIEVIGDNIDRIERGEEPHTQVHRTTY